MSNKWIDDFKKHIPSFITNWMGYIQDVDKKEPDVVPYCGIGRPSEVDFKRKFRWVFEAELNGEPFFEPHFVKINQRPTLHIEEVQVRAGTWIPGLQAWDSIVITYCGVEDFDDNSLFYKSLSKAYDAQSNLSDDPTGEHDLCRFTGTLTMYDGCGTPVEKWKLNQCFLQAVNFGDLDFSNSSELTVEITIRYDSVEYENLS